MTDDSAERQETESEVPTAARGVRRVLRTAGRVFACGVLPGALIYAAMFGLSVWLHRSGEFFGVEVKEVTDALTKTFWDDIMAQQARLAGNYLVIGVIVGLVAYAWLWLLAAARRRQLSWRKHLGLVLLVVFAIHCWFLLRSIATYPQMYAPKAANSVLLEVLFWLATDVLTLGFIKLLGGLFWASFLGMAALSAWRRYGDALAPKRRKGILGAGLVAGVTASLVVTFGMSGPGAPRFGKDPARPNILVLAIDSLRSDLIGGEPRGVTPNIEDFARRAVLFRNTYSVLPRTLPAWASMLTGQYPHGHGIRHMFPAPKRRKPLTQSVASILRDAGYRTGVLSDSAGEVFGRVDMGFEHVEVGAFNLRDNVELEGIKLHVHLLPYLVDVLEGSSEPAIQSFERLTVPQWQTDQALRWLSQDDDRPFFLTVFYSCGHFPYASPAPWYERFVDPDYRGRSRFHKEVFGKQSQGSVSEAEQQQVRGLYHGAVAASDAAVGRLLRALEDSGALANTVVVVTADHGENLYEDGLVGHGDHLYGKASLAVPLLLYWPGLANPGRVIDTNVRSLDLAPTLLGRAGLPARTPMDGVDLAPIATGSTPAEPLPVFLETGLWFYPPETDRLDGRRIEFAEGLSAFRPDKQWNIYLAESFRDTAIMAKHRALLSGDHKLLYMPTRQRVVWELYDVRRDPAEQINLVESQPQRFEAMKAELYRWLLADPEMVRVGEYVLPRRALDPNTLARLTQ